MTPKVIKFAQKEEKIKKILFDYTPEKVVNNYKNAEDLLNIFKDSFSDIKKDAGNKSIWYKFSKSILSGAKFLSTFKSKEDFDNFIKNFNLNKYTKASLPMLLSKEINGFGFALSCDFLKELGYREYPKPDIHLIDLFYGLGISISRDDYEVYKDIIEFSDIIGKDAYTVDKIFWLICSGNFYRINKKMKPKKWEFIDYINQKLKLIDKI